MFAIFLISKSIAVSYSTQVLAYSKHACDKYLVLFETFIQSVESSDYI
jgi:hypothetical protein